ncbi:hypothetical protein [Streptococcus dentapri]
MGPPVFAIPSYYDLVGSATVSNVVDIIGNAIAHYYWVVIN